METKSTLPAAWPLRPPVPIDAPKDFLRREQRARHAPDPEHRFHPRGRPGDSRALVAAGGAMVRVRARHPEFHKPAEIALAAAAPRPRQIHGGLVCKRRAGK
jgi:hypothetical protein